MSIFFHSSLPPILKVSKKFPLLKQSVKSYQSPHNDRLHKANL